MKYNYAAAAFAVITMKCVEAQDVQVGHPRLRGPWAIQGHANLKDVSHRWVSGPVLKDDLAMDHVHLLRGVENGHADDDLLSRLLVRANKVEICHLPPGDPENFHTITVNENALDAHLAHGDMMGPCDQHCETLCDDGDLCTWDDCASDGPGCVHGPADCDDSIECTVDTCDPNNGCLYTSNCEDNQYCDSSAPPGKCSPCTDHDSNCLTCTKTECTMCKEKIGTCLVDGRWSSLNGECEYTASHQSCDDSIACTDDSCEETTGECTHRSNCSAEQYCSTDTNSCEPTGCTEDGACELPEDFNPMEVRMRCDDEGECVPTCIDEETSCYDGGQGDGVCRRCTDFCPLLSFTFRVHFGDAPILNFNDTGLAISGLTEDQVMSTLSTSYPELWELTGQICNVTVTHMEDIVGSNEPGHHQMDGNYNNGRDLRRSFSAYGPSYRKNGYAIETTCALGSQYLQSFTQPRPVKEKDSVTGQVRTFGTDVGYFRVETQSKYNTDGTPWYTNMKFSFSVAAYAVAQVSGTVGDPPSPTPGDGGSEGDDPWWLPSGVAIYVPVMEHTMISHDSQGFVDLFNTPSTSWIRHADLDGYWEMADYPGFVRIDPFQWRASIGNDPDEYVETLLTDNYWSLKADVELIDFVNAGQAPCHFKENQTCDFLCHDCDDNRCQDLTDTCYRPACVTPLVECQSTNAPPCVGSGVNLDQVLANAVDGDVVALCENTQFVVDNRLLLRANNATLCCAGETASCVLTGGANNDHGILLILGHSARIEGIKFEGGKYPSGSGGAIRFAPVDDVGENYAIVNSEFRANTAWGSGGAVNVAQASSIILLGCVFTENTIPTTGAGAGGISLGGLDQAIIQDCMFDGNVGQRGGLAIRSVNQLTIEGNQFINNTGISGGAGKVELYAFQNLKLIDNTGSDNIAQNQNMFGLCHDFEMTGFFGPMGSGPNGCYCLDGTLGCNI